LESSRGTFSESFSEADASLFSLPNNILGIEYCRALDVLKSPIRPITIRRRGNYHDTGLKEAHEGAASIKASSTPDTPFSSASAIRAALKNTGSSDTDAPGPEESLFSSLPDTSRRLLFERSDGRGIVTEEDFSSLLRYRLLQLIEEGIPRENGIRTASSAALTAFADVTPSLADKIVRHLYTFTGWDDFCLRLRSRDLPYVRASRSLCHILLNLKQDALDESKAEGFPVYLRMLGFSERALPLLTAIKKEAASPLLSRLTAAREQLSPTLLPLLEEEIRASHIYQTIVSGKYGTPFLHEYQRQILCPPFNS
ncbi:MAG TPA: nucleotidyltransferase family protein, partial [Candidatus Eisenbergiella intestinigallinarum]|nr:nucleotidyltransferase family protein [Candidatus Eisenbergiella intestinigallinarum]